MPRFSVRLTSMYEYRATLIRVVDGDTIDVDIDLGFGVHMQTRLRLAYINAPERGTPEGTAATNYVVKRLVEPFTVRTSKDAKEKYGRYLATVILPDGEVLNSTMLAKGVAKPYGV